jgi:hypothetical protein
MNGHPYCDCAAVSCTRLEEVAVVAVEVSHLEVEEADSGDHDDSTQNCVSPGARRVALV